MVGAAGGGEGGGWVEGGLVERHDRLFDAKTYSLGRTHTPVEDTFAMNAHSIYFVFQLSHSFSCSF